MSTNVIPNKILKTANNIYATHILQLSPHKEIEHWKATGIRHLQIHHLLLITLHLLRSFVLLFHLRGYICLAPFIFNIDDDDDDAPLLVLVLW